MFIVRNSGGLHTRPATELVRCAIGFKSAIVVRYEKQEVNAKSLLSVLMLAAARGSEIYVEATGDDAKQAIDALMQLAKENFKVNY